jgi:hypothetical protein
MKTEMEEKRKSKEKNEKKVRIQTSTKKRRIIVEMLHGKPISQGGKKMGDQNTPSKSPIHKSKYPSSENNSNASCAEVW